jgi:dTMP kinase
VIGLSVVEALEAVCIGRSVIAAPRLTIDFDCMESPHRERPVFGISFTLHPSPFTLFFALYPSPFTLHYNAPMSGYFLAVEGIEGSGKTTQLRRLATLLREDGQQIVTTKEPGGTPLADRIRAILLDPQEEGMDPLTELFLYLASRRQHVVEIIRPALETGVTVLCDRYVDATLAYQGFGRRLDLDRLRAINDWATDSILPDLTLVYDLPESVGLARARKRNESSAHLQGESRLEGEDIRFHRRVREGYLALAESEPARYSVIDANGTVDEVFDRTWSAVMNRSPLSGSLRPRT